MAKNYTKTKWTLASVLLLLLILRLCLPYLIIHYVEQQVNKIPEYRVKIDDLDVHLIRGSYTIRHLQLWKFSKHIPVPFFAAATIDLAIEWSALLHGALVGTIRIDQPEINFVLDQKNGNDQLSIDEQWLTVVKSLFPLNFNSITVSNGQVNFRSYTGKPPFNVYLHAVAIAVSNMQNARNTQAVLPSNLSLRGQVMNQGSLALQGRFNPLSKKPAFFFTASLKALAVPEIKQLLKHFTSVDVHAGTFSLYGEIGAANDKITGYAKPFIKNLAIKAPTDSSLIEKIWDGTAALVATVLQNHAEQTIATKITIEGDLDDPDTSLLSILGYLLRHAFIQALLPQLDHDVTMQNVIWRSHQSPGQPGQSTGLKH